MAGAQTTVERLRQFLRELSPGARSLLIGELERAVLRGEDVSGAELVLQELRRIVRDQRHGGPRIENSARLLFKPLEPFLVDDRGDHRSSRTYRAIITRCAVELGPPRSTTQ